jgi:hypothetical protein
MQDIKTGPARPSFWCGILTAEKQALAPSQARTVRGPYTTFNIANTQREKTGGATGQGTSNGAGQEEDN